MITITKPENSYSPITIANKIQMAMNTFRFKCGLFSFKGDLILPDVTDSVKFSDGLALICQNEKWGYINELGDIVIPCKYEEANSFVDGLAWVCINGTYWNINKNGERVSLYEEDEVIIIKNDESHKLFPFRKKDKWGYVDSFGEIIVQSEYDEAKPFYYGLGKVRKQKKWGYVDWRGEEVITCKYIYLHDIKDGLIQFRWEGKWGYMDTKGAIVIPNTITDQYTGEISEGLAGVCYDGKYGFYDKYGNEVIRCKYDSIGRFSEGLAYVSICGKFGYIDTTGKVIIPLIYEMANSFSQGKALVHKNGIPMLIDRTGQVILVCPCEVAWIEPFFNNMAVFHCYLGDEDPYGKCGLIDSSGQVIIPCIFEDISILGNGIIHVKKCN